MRMIKLKCVKGLFSGRHFDREVILQCGRWSLRYKLSQRDRVEMMAERELELAHTTILRWIQRYVPEFEKGWACHARKARVRPHQHHSGRLCGIAPGGA